jgi:hypothetical protein
MKLKLTLTFSLVIPLLMSAQSNKLVLNDTVVIRQASDIHQALFSQKGKKKVDQYFDYYNNSLSHVLNDSEFFKGTLENEDMKSRAIIFIHRKLKKGTFELPDFYDNMTSLSDQIYNSISNTYKQYEHITDIERLSYFINEEIEILERINYKSQIANYKTIKLNLVNQLNLYGSKSDGDMEAETYKKARGLLIDQYEAETSEFVDEKIETVVVSKRGTEWSDDIIGIDNILVVIIDSHGDLGYGKFKIKNQKSSFEGELSNVGDLAVILFEKMGEKSENSYLINESVKVRLVELNSKKINTPSQLRYIYKLKSEEKNDTLSFELLEKINLNLKLGVTSALIDRQIFKIDNKQLIVSPDSTTKDEWKQHLMINFVIRPFYHTKEYKPKLFKYDEENSFGKRLGIVAGFNFSLTPLDNLYTGISYDLSEYFTLAIGATWNNSLVSDTIDIGDIASVKDALSLGRKNYSGAKFFWGITFSPSTIGKILGIKEDE